MYISIVLSNKPITGFFFLSLCLKNHFYSTIAFVETINSSHSFEISLFFYSFFVHRFFKWLLFHSFSIGYHFPPDGYYPSEYAIYEADACLCMILINRRVRTATFNLWIERLYAMRHVIGMSCGTSLIGWTIGGGKIEFSMRLIYIHE